MPSEENLIKGIEKAQELLGGDVRCDICGCLIMTKEIIPARGKPIMQTYCSNKECKNHVRKQR